MSISSIIESLDGRTGGTFICPSCQGGRSRERSLSLHNCGGVYLWLCHRAKCREKGAMATTGSLDVRVPRFLPTVFKEDYRIPNYPTHKDAIARQIMTAVPDEPVFAFAALHGLRVLVDVPTTTVWLVRNIHAVRIGVATRSVTKFIQTYHAVDAPFYAYFKPNSSATVWKRAITVIVEDPMSAALVAHDGIPAISLLGANLSREAAAEIIGADNSRTYMVALDPDYAGLNATDAVKNRLRALGAQVQVWPLQKDIKDMPSAERHAIISEMAWGKA